VRGLAFRRITQLQNEAEQARAAAAAAELRLSERLAHLTALQATAESASRESDERAADAESRLRDAEELLRERSAAAESHRCHAERLEAQLVRLEAEVSAGGSVMAVMEEVIHSEARTRRTLTIPPCRSTQISFIPQ
jgi:chromosome segregation ATPase